MMLIVNNKEVMGKHVNKLPGNIFGWLTIVILVVLSVILLVTSI